MTLQVIVARDGTGWIAHAIEVDYAAGGNSETDAGERFLTGLRATAEAQLERHGNLSALLTPASPEAWAPLAADHDGARVRIRRQAVNLREAGLRFDTVAFIAIRARTRPGVTIH